MGDNEACDVMSGLQQTLDALNGWDLERRARALIDSMGLDADACLSTLSGVVNAVFC